MFPIPRPEFVVLYNGVDEMQDEQTLKLSDMFAKYGKKNPIELELKVKIFNINKGRNTAIAKRSATLQGYEQFIHMVRKYQKECTDFKDAVLKAITYCTKRNILKDFLLNHSKEVINMLTKEWNLKDAVRVGREEGREKTLEEIQKLIKQGITDANEILKMLEKKIKK
ncbi:MAG: hypothetical protein LBI42_05780 [Chitinispirillales bacterium]|jgi:hypothetical protein|nr:hypothetical protein [Chitinispirillales bacterium]